ncbi:MAG TPA: FUSC family protein [Streptosporangiaceae bacterium]
MTSGAGEAIASAFRVDRSALRPGAAARATAGVVLPLIAGVAAGQPAIGAAAAFGAFSVGIATITAGPRTPGGTMLATSLGMGLATFVGSVSGLVPAAHLIVLAAAGFVAGLLVAAGSGATQVGINATIALLVFGRFAVPPALAALHGGWVLAGGLFQTGLALVIRSPRPLRSQRAALALAYDALAGAAGGGGQLPITVSEAAATARNVIGPWLQAVDRPQAQQLRGLTDQLDRIRHEVHGLQAGQAPLAEQDRELVGDGLALAAGALHEIAASLRDARAPVGIAAVAEGLQELADHVPEGQGAGGHGPGGQSDGPGFPAAGSPGPAAGPAETTGQLPAADVRHGAQAGPPAVEVPKPPRLRPPSMAGPAARFAAARMGALAGQLRAVNRMATELAGVRRISLPVSAAHAADAIIVLPAGVVAVLRRVRAAMSPSSPAFRHGVRLAVVIPLATVISAVLPWPRGYWLPLTALIVLKPDFAATVSIGFARVIGTAAGVLAGAVVIATVHPGGALLIVLIALSTWLSYAVFAANYAIYAVFLTAYVILSIAASQASPLSAVENRGFDTLIGGGLAILAYLVWPTWEARTLQTATAERFEAIRRYLDAVLHAYLDPGAYNSAALERLAADTRRAQSAVAASLDRARGEPALTRPDVSRYAGVLSAGRRIVAGTHALASHLRDARQAIAVPAATVITGQIGVAMTELVRALRESEPPGPLPDLRAAHRRLTVATATGRTPADRRGAILAALLDPLVDSIDTAADLLGGER